MNENLDFIGQIIEEYEDKRELRRWRETMQHGLPQINGPCPTSSMRRACGSPQGGGQPLTRQEPTK